MNNPISVDFVDSYAAVLGNLPQDDGKFRCYVGVLQKVRKQILPVLKDYSKLKGATSLIKKQGLLLSSEPSSFSDLKECEIKEGKDKQDPSVAFRIFFTGIEEGKVISLKPGLRGIFVRIHGRLLKHSFTDQKYVYPISKWVKFANGLRVELGIDWLRNEISLSRDDLKFANAKLEEQFRSTLSRVVSAFIQPQLKKLERKSAQVAAKAQSQRIELANRRSQRTGGIKVPGIKTGFNFIPETDGELALLVSNDEVIKRVNAAYKLIDYNDSAPYDCIIYDAARRGFVHVELEPTLMEFLQHKVVPSELSLIIVWSLGKWRVGSIKKGKRGFYRLISDRGSKAGHLRLLAYKQKKSAKPFTSYQVVALEHIFRK